MKYKTISIRRRDLSNTWDVTIEHDKKDRELTETSPHWLGFYHYPEEISDAKAFKKLKEYLLQRERAALELVQLKIAELEALDLPKPTKGKDDGNPKRKPKVRTVKGRGVHST
jgi:hypothetical protein